MHVRTTVVAPFLFALFTLPAAAQQATAEADPGQQEVAQVAPIDASSDAQIQELRCRIDLPAAELDLQQSGESHQEELTTARRDSLGLATSATST
mgnify:CR=1 FL=1